MAKIRYTKKEKEFLKTKICEYKDTGMWFSSMKIDDKDNLSQLIEIMAHHQQFNLLSNFIKEFINIEDVLEFLNDKT